MEILRVESLLRRRMGMNLEDPQRIHFHQLILIAAGSTTHTVDFAPLSVVPGTLLITRAGQVQAFGPERGIRGPLALFTPWFLEGRSLGTTGLAGASRLLLAAGPAVQLGYASRARAIHAFDTLGLVASAPQSRFADEGVGAAFAMFVFELAGLPEVLAAAAGSESEDELVARFFRLLEERFSAGGNVDSFARGLHVSIRTLDRRLLAARAVTARQAIRARILLEAKRMLTARELPIKAVADKLGFTEPQNFTRFFRTQAGVSPQAFRDGLVRPGNPPPPGKRERGRERRVRGGPARGTTARP
ncbi:MAG: helix-turn-helix transcriptional regulator [Deltaproteobacteria bacterium]|nr:helix-turn-helix transcriptional regulator [Deltaproteobacteria bacterium]